MPSAGYILHPHKDNACKNSREGGGGGVEETPGSLQTSSTDRPSLQAAHTANTRLLQHAVVSLTLTSASSGSTGAVRSGSREVPSRSACGSTGSVATQCTEAEQPKPAHVHNAI